MANLKKTFFAAFAALMLLVVLGSSYWHGFGMERPLTEAWLERYDAAVPDGRDACFAITFAQSNANLSQFGNEYSGKTENLKVIAGKTVVFGGKVALAENKTNEYCVPSSVLADGDNLVEIEFDSGRLFFHVSKGENEARVNLAPIAATEARVGIAQIAANSGQGAGLVSPIFGMLALILIIAAVFTAFMRRHELLEAALFTLVFISAALIVLPWLLNFPGIGLNFYAVGGGVAAASVLLFIFYGRGGNAAGRQNSEEPWGENRKLLLYFLLFGALLALLHLYTPSHFSNWNVFYERYSEMIVQAGKIPVQDPLSYLGRGYTFTWGYFLFESSLAFITGLSGTALFSLVYFLVNSLFFLSVLYFVRSFRGFTLEHGIIFYLLLASSLFIFVNIAVSPKHILSFSFLFFAVAMLIRGKNAVLAGCAVALAAFTQVPFLILFPITMAAIGRGTGWRRFFIAMASAIVLFGILFAPILLQNGMPYEIKSREWGYLIKHGPGELLVDLGQVVALLFAYALFRVLRGWRTIDTYTMRLFYASIALILLQLFVFYRINIVTHLVLTLLLFHVLAQDWGNKYMRNMLVALGIIAVLANIVIVSYSVAWEQQVAPLQFLQERTAPNERLLADPYYGHLATYFTQRPVLADLYVEYADEGKLEDAYRFILDGDESVLRKYGIKYTFTDEEKIFTDAKTQHYFAEPKEFGFMDKVYTNGTFSIHRARG
ncbi:MAG: hypothetical protein V1676_00955 [Candidatus Diapherotrites archaeon]